MTPDALPPEAITAAGKGVMATFGADRAMASESIIRYALEAAAPHLAAAEREACAQLAELHGATYPAPCTMADCPCSPLGESQHPEPFADLLRKDHR